MVMRICFTSYADLTDATVLNFFHIGEELAKQGHRVTLLAPRIGKAGELYVTSSTALILKKFTILQFTREMKIASHTIIQSFRTLRTDFDLIHAIKPLVQSSLPALLAGCMKCKSRVLHLDDYEAYGALLMAYPPLYAKLVKWFEKVVMRRYDAITCVSPFLHNLAAHTLLAHRVFLIPNGFDANTFRRKAHWSVREHFDIQGKLAVYVGGLRTNTDIDFAITSFRHVAKKFPRSTLLIVGDGPLKNELVQLSRKLGIAKNVIFVGNRPHAEMPHFLRAADVLLLPFRKNLFNEARFSNKIPEYMASGKAIVTNSVGIVNKIFQDGKNALIVKPDDPKLFAQAVCRLFADQELARRIGRCAKRYAWKNLTWQVITRRYEEVYRDFV
jgi:glycosyltransferase involved in cell wall biosynthesis